VDRKDIAFRLDSTPLDEHPAVAACEALGLSSRRPWAIESLTDAKGRPSNRKSWVFRLRGRNRAELTLIAKRSRRASIHLEASVYRDILPQIPVRSLQCYGHVDDANSEFAWLILDFAQGSSYREDRSEHRIGAAEWLGDVHAASSQLQMPDLPICDANRYLNFLRAARTNIQTSLSNPSFTRKHLDGLDSIVGTCDLLESLWQELEVLCSTSPPCLVHGDFIAKNVKVSNDHNPIIMAFDWEAAGWGTPFEDLGALDTTVQDMHGVDVHAYWRKVRDRWPGADLDSVEKMVNVGIVFRYIEFIQDTSAGLKSDWVEPTVHALCDYEHRLKAGARMAGLI
jgi:hypothetical protein